MSLLRRLLRVLVLGTLKVLGGVADGLLLGRHRRRIGIVPYRSFGGPAGWWVRGRVVVGGGIHMEGDDGAWINLRNMYRRFRTRPLPSARVRVRLGAQAVETRSDERGFFEARLDPLADAHPEAEWHHADLELLEPAWPGQAPPRARAPILVCPRSAAFGVISDIDDTVMFTHATDKRRMLRLLLLHNAHTRLPFPGVAAFYSALHQGRGGQRNPIFYVSSSAWNIYDVMGAFMEIHGLPDGPILLRDLRFNRSSLVGARRHEHKLERIRLIFDACPGLPFLLIGDSGQHDPELYARTVADHPGRVLAIYLRQVGRYDRRRAAIEALADQVQARGVDFLVVPDTLAAAHHAAERGWIDPAELPGIAAERDEPPEPALVGALLDDEEERGAD